MSDLDREEIGRRLLDEISTVERMAWTLRMMLPQSETAIESEAHRVCEWMRDAAKALSPADRGGGKS